MRNSLVRENEIKYNYYKTIQYFTHFSFYYTFYLNPNLDKDNAWTTLQGGGGFGFRNVGGDSTALIAINNVLNE